MSEIPIQSEITYLGINIFSGLPDLIHKTMEEELMPCRNIPFSLMERIATIKRRSSQQLQIPIPTATHSAQNCLVYI